MKKISVFSIILIFSLLLAACGEAGVSDADLTATAASGGLEPGLGEGTPGLGDETPGLVDETPLSPGGVETAVVETPEATQGAGAVGTATQAIGGGAGGTGTPSAGAGTGTPSAGTGTGTPSAGAGTTRTPVAGGVAETPAGTPSAGGEGIPVTGSVNVVRVSELIGFDVEAASAAGSEGGSGQAQETPSGTETTTAPGAQATDTPEATGGTGTGDSTMGVEEGEPVGEVSDVVVRVDSDEVGSGIAVDSEDQASVWLVVSIQEGFLGLGPDTLVAVPLRNVQVFMDRQVVLLPFDPARFENAPSFTDDEWNNFDDSDWLDEVDQFWLDEGGVGAGSTEQPSGTGTPTAGAGGQQASTSTPSAGAGGTQTTAVAELSNFVRLSQVLDAEVQADNMTGVGTPAASGTDTAGQQTSTPGPGGTQQATTTPGGTGQGVGDDQLGTVADVVINLTGNEGDMTSAQDQDNTEGQHARVQYVVVTLDAAVMGDSTDAGNLVMLPWSLVRSFDEDNNVVSVDVDVEQLQQAPSFNEDEWLDFDFASSTWDQEVRDFWTDEIGTSP